METLQGNFNQQPMAEQPPMYGVDATKAKSLEELGLLFNALGLGMTKEYAEQNGLLHLLILK